LGFVESNCSTTYPGGNPYTCCDCAEADFRCTSNSQCDDGSSCTTDTCSSGTCSNTDNGTCDITPPPDEPPDYECIWPYCLDSGYDLAANCSEDCESANHWLNEVYYICAESGSYYNCSNDVDGGIYSYDWEACYYCGGPCKCADEYGWCMEPSVGSTGRCNSYLTSRKWSTIPESIALCSRGTGVSTPVLNGNYWVWTCDGTDGTCGAAKGASVGCSAVANSPPIFNSLIIKNDKNITVPVETGNKNQICQTAFNRSRSVNFTVGASDPDGTADITNVTLTWNGNTITRKSSIGATTTFGTTFPSAYNSNSIYPFVVTITDSAGNTAVDTSRYFKTWDCKVSISGTIFDATDDGDPVCPSVGFTKQADPLALNFTSLAFTGGGIGVSMTTINSPNYNSGSNYLTWGINTNISSFNTDISLTDPKIRFKSLSSVSWNCPTNTYVDTTILDPYSTDPMSITADFSGILIQDSWWQASEGGVIGNSKVTGQIPITCTTNCQISLNGLVAAPTVENDTTKSLENSQSWFYSATPAKLANVNTNYSYFYSQYFVKKGIGTTLIGNKTITSISDLGSDTNYIYFIDGDLNINGNIVNTNNFLMIIVSGDITVSQDADRVDGILVANNIYANGASNTQLVFNGSLFAFNNVDFSRDYIDRVINNSTPAVVVNYNPKLIFNLPGSVAKVLTDWQWGN